MPDRKADPAEAARLAQARADEQAREFAEPEPEDQRRKINTELVTQVATSGGEVGEGRLAAEMLAGRFAFDRAENRFYRCAGGPWERDELDTASQAIHDLLRGLYEEHSLALREKAADPRLDQDDQKRLHRQGMALSKAAERISGSRRLGNVVRLACSGAGSLAVPGNKWCLDKWLLPAKNAVIDLRTGLARPIKPEDHIRLLSPVEWCGLDTPAPAWEQFVDSILDGEKEIVGFLHRVLGYCASGDTSLQELFALTGKGRNGKGVLLETVRKVLGPFASPVDSSLIMGFRTNANASGASPEILDLQNRRLVWASETSENQALNVEKVKKLTGQDTLKGRALYGEMTEFEPTHKLLLLTNHRPRVGSNEYALWDRLKLIEFPLSFVDDPTEDFERKRDPRLSEKLEAELPGILAWIVRGSLEIQRRGLEPPWQVLEAVKDYSTAEDQLGAFIKSRCVTGERYSVQAGEFIKAFTEWYAEENGPATKPPGARTLRNWLLGRGFKADNSGRHVRYVGLALDDE